MSKKISDVRVFNKKTIFGFFLILNSFLCYGETHGEPVISGCPETSFPHVFSGNPCLKSAKKLDSGQKNAGMTSKILVFGQALIKEILEDGYRVTLDLSSQVLFLEVPDDKFSGTMKGKVKEKAAEIYPNLKSIPEGYMNFISTALIAQKTKNFDDGLVGAVEILCQNGADKFTGKREMLRKLLATLQTIRVKKEDSQAHEKCQALIYNALSLGGHKPKVSEKVKKIALDSLNDFLSNKLSSKPIGFYTWNDDLKKIFQQDRYLQRPVYSTKESKIISNALAKEEELSSSYGAVLSSVEKINNPFPAEYCDFRAGTEKKAKGCAYCFIPPSMAHETELIKRLYGGRPIPKGFSLIDALVEEIKAGNITLKLKENSGWYDYKTNALEPFLLPEKMIEAAKLKFGEKYKNELIKLFKALLALTRETHIKNLEVALAGAAMPEPAIKIYPELTIEPVATYYLRLGNSYGFIGKVIQEYFSDSTLTQSYRIMPDGKSESPENLLDELKNIESLMYGLFSVTAQEIGLNAVSNVLNRPADQVMNDMKTAQEWIKSLTEDKDLYADNRVMVPVFYDVQRKMTKVWVVLGYSVKPLTISFDKNPLYTVTDKKGKQVKKKVEFHETMKHLIYPVSAEVYTNKILNREEFRSLCDSLKTQNAILHALTNK